MSLSVMLVWVGAVTESTAWVRCRTAPATSATLKVSTQPNHSNPIAIGPNAPETDGVVSWQVTGLAPSTRYYYVIDDGALNTDWAGTFRTHPPLGTPADFTIGAAGDAGLTGALGDDSNITNAVSNSPVFDTMRIQALAEEWLWFSHLGDIHYRNIATNDPALYRAAYNDVLTYNLGFNPSARQGQFLRNVAMTYMWDDHDYGPNNSDRTSAAKPAAQTVYRERVPSYPLPAGTGANPIYQSWQCGRVLFIASDTRSLRDPNSTPAAPTKTMLGTAQKTWMEQVLTTTTAEALVWIMPSQWLGAGTDGGSDTWDNFIHERRELVQMFGDLRWLDRMIQLTADKHALAISSGPGNQYGGFPIFMLAAMDAAYDQPQGLYDLGQLPIRGGYGTVSVRDAGHTIALTGTGYVNGTVWRSHTAYVHLGSPIFALDYAARHLSPPLEPTEDDQGRRNDVTAQRDGGGEARVSQETGPLNVQAPEVDPDGVGTYDEAVTVNVAADEQLENQAGWRVHMDTVDEPRYPLLHLNLSKNPGLITGITELGLGDRLSIANPPPWLPPGDINLIAEGQTETIGVRTWDIELNAAPGSPWTVARVLRQIPEMPAAEDFEDTTYTITITKRGSLPWTRTSAQFHAGAWSLRSGAISNNQTSDAIVTVPEGAQTLTFWYRVSSETSGPGFEGDRLLVLVDGVQVLRAQGTVGWTQTTVDVTDAAAVTFRYAKDNSTASGEDAAYIDDLSFTATMGGVAGPDQPNRLDTTGSQLVTAAGVADTALVVRTPPDGTFDRAPWISSAGPGTLFADEFPFDVRLGGEVARVTACEPAVWDTFARTTSNGWGTASSGQAWTSTGGSASDYSTNGSAGVHSLGTINISRYTVTAAPYPDLDITADVSTSVLATGGPHYLHLVARWLDANNMYAVRLGFMSTQTLQLVLQKRVGGTQTDMFTVTVPGTHFAGAFYATRFRLDGSTLRAKAWPRTVAEPAGWHATVTDTALTAAGSVGVRSSLSSLNTNALPVAASWDNFQLLTTQRMTVNRSINTVSKSHAAGTAVSLAQPAALAL
ncbi:alkaline phosphatase D family protein [Streptomyces sp. NPDC000941]